MTRNKEKMMLNVFSIHAVYSFFIHSKGLHTYITENYTTTQKYITTKKYTFTSHLCGPNCLYAVYILFLNKFNYRIEK